MKKTALFLMVPMGLMASIGVAAAHADYSMNCDDSGAACVLSVTQGGETATFEIAADEVSEDKILSMLGFTKSQVRDAKQRDAGLDRLLRDVGLGRAGRAATTDRGGLGAQVSGETIGGKSANQALQISELAPGLDPVDPPATPAFMGPIRMVVCAVNFAEQNQTCFNDCNSNCGSNGVKNVSYTDNGSCGQNGTCNCTCHPPAGD